MSAEKNSTNEVNYESVVGNYVGIETNHAAHITDVLRLDNAIVEEVRFDDSFISKWWPSVFIDFIVLPQDPKSEERRIGASVRLNQASAHILLERLTDWADKGAACDLKAVEEETQRRKGNDLVRENDILEQAKNIRSNRRAYRAEDKMINDHLNDEMKRKADESRTK